MLMPRIIPTLLLDDGGFVKTKKFKKPDYVGDPVNVINLFNRFEVDEIVILDISATLKKRSPDFELIEDLANECWVPLAYGGGLNNIDDIKRIFSLGIEKVIVNSAAYYNPEVVKDAVSIYGAQAIVASVDLGIDFWGKRQAYTHSGKVKIKKPYMEYIQSLQDLGVGEIFVNFINLDGTWQGYDTETISEIVEKLQIPVVVCGGAKDRKSFVDPLAVGASAVAAGSLFVYKGQGKGVLINYPERDEVEEIFRIARK